MMHKVASFYNLFPSFVHSTPCCKVQLGLETKVGPKETSDFTTYLMLCSCGNTLCVDPVLDHLSFFHSLALRPSSRPNPIDKK